ncbi:MAG: sigma-E processing peptidase SpoIIGA [Oscillibacter sp.]|nr:sigma-E processing peptidase SpoIIGA [Oscillibacter sp.]
MTVVYIDSVFVLNTLMDYLLVLATAKLAGIPLHRGRYLFAALLGGVYAVAVFLPGCGALSSWPAKLAAGTAMAAAAYVGEERFWRLTLLLFVVSCGFAGCVLGLGLLAGGGVPVERGIFYTDVNATVLLAAAGGAYLVFSLVFRACARNGLKRTLIPAQVSLNGKTVELTALRDTGNALLDPVTNRPLLVVCASSMGTLWPPELARVLTPRAIACPAEVLEELNRNTVRFRLVPYSAVGVAGGLLLAFRSDWVLIGKKRYDGLLVALSPTSLGGGFTALWGEGE